MDELCWTLSLIIGRPLVDETGLKGYYDYSLEFVMPEYGRPFATELGDSPPPPEPEGSSIFTAVREQLGLKLDGQKRPVEVFVIDSIQRPSVN